jgi:hypothetical protein
MSSKKLKYYEILEVASAIANKAFEHLIEPLEKERNYIAGQVYERVFTDRGVTPEQIRPFRGTDNVAYATLDNGKGESVIVTYRAEGLVNLSHYGSDKLTVVDEQLFDIYRAAEEAIEPFTGKRYDLDMTLRNQMEGKTVNQIIKAWPEAAPFMTKWLTPTANMTVPLENLLARFLPALPAPEA